MTSRQPRQRNGQFGRAPRPEADPEVMRGLMEDLRRAEEQRLRLEAAATALLEQTVQADDRLNRLELALQAHTDQMTRQLGEMRELVETLSYEMSGYPSYHADLPEQAQRTGARLRELVVDVRNNLIATAVWPLVVELLDWLFRFAVWLCSWGGPR